MSNQSFRDLLRESTLIRRKLARARKGLVAAIEDAKEVRRKLLTERARRDRHLRKP